VLSGRFTFKVGHDEFADRRRRFDFLRRGRIALVPERVERPNKAYDALGLHRAIGDLRGPQSSYRTPRARSSAGFFG